MVFSMYQKEKQIYNESHCIYHFGSQELLHLNNVDNFHIFILLCHVHINVKTSRLPFDEVFKLKV